MPRFSYSAITPRGDEQTGLLDAPNAEQAVASLKAKGFFPTVVTPSAAVAPSRVAAAPTKSGLTSLGRERTPNRVTAAATRTTRSAAPFADRAAGKRENFSGLKIPLPFARPVKPRELTLFTRQLATLLRAGMPLLRGLETLARQERRAALRGIITALADDLRSGAALSDAMARHPRAFDGLFASMVRAGEAGGMLDVVLERLAKFQEKSLQLRGKMKAAMVYPLVVVSVATLILAGLLVFVVPKFRQIFADLLKGAPLPPLTQAVLAAGEFAKSHYGIALAAAVLLGIGCRFFSRTRTGRYALDALAVRLPLFGDLLLKSIVARFSRTLGTLLAGGVPILSALSIARDTCGNTQVAAALSEAHERVKAGEPFARPLATSPIFPAMVASMVEVGEQTGQLPEMLGKLADIYDEEVDNAVAGLSSLVEPLLIVFLALVVGTIVIALFLPIVRIVQLLT